MHSPYNEWWLAKYLWSPSRLWFIFRIWKSIWIRAYQLWYRQFRQPWCVYDYNFLNFNHGRLDWYDVQLYGHKLEQHFSGNLFLHCSPLWLILCHESNSCCNHGQLWLKFSANSRLRHKRRIEKPGWWVAYFKTQRRFSPKARPKNLWNESKLNKSNW